MILVCIIIGIVALAIGIMAIAMKQYIIAAVMLTVTGWQFINYRTWKKRI